MLEFQFRQRQRKDGAKVVRFELQIILCHQSSKGMTGILRNEFILSMALFVAAVQNAGRHCHLLFQESANGKHRRQNFHQIPRSHGRSDSVAFVGDFNSQVSVELPFDEARNPGQALLQCSKIPVRTAEKQTARFEIEGQKFDLAKTVRERRIPDQVVDRPHQR